MNKKIIYGIVAFSLFVLLALTGCASSANKSTSSSLFNVTSVSGDMFIETENNMSELKKLKQFKFIDIAALKAKKDSESSLITCLDSNNIVFDAKNNVAVYIRAAVYEAPKEEGGYTTWNIYVDKADFKNNKVWTLSGGMLVPMDSPIASVEGAKYVCSDSHGNKTGIVFYKKNTAGDALDIDKMQDTHLQKLVYVVQDACRTHEIVSMGK